MINIWALIGSMIMSVLLGFVWYGPLFGKKWMALSGIVMPDQKPSMKVMVQPMILSFIGAIFMTSTLSFFIAFHDAYFLTTGLSSALGTAFLVWLGFIVPVYLNFAGWEHKPWTLFLINSGYWLVFLFLSAGLITVLS